jgi:ADP-ribose pyrophosphatase YjhB (NUDIX family)
MVLRCSNEDCKASSYPRIEPATMNFVTDQTNRYTLLGRKATWPEKRYSCLAGFLEVGETLEQCVVRETYEESGVRLYEDSIVYAGSQPWPFPSSLMVGYRAVAAGGNSGRDVEEEEEEEEEDLQAGKLVVEDSTSNGAAGGVQEIILGMGRGGTSVNAEGAVVLDTVLSPRSATGQKGGEEEWQERRRRRALPTINFDATEMDDVAWFSRDQVREALSRSRGSTSLGHDLGFTEAEKSDHGLLHFPGPSSMARVMLTMWALEEHEEEQEEP